MSTSDYASDTDTSGGTPFSSKVSSYIDVREAESTFREDLRAITKKMSKATLNGQDWIKCHFFFKSDKQCAVFLTGDFTSWDRRPIPLKPCESGYETTILLLKGVYEYKFRVDDKWISDPENPYKSAQFGNSLLFVRVDPAGWRCNSWKMPSLEYTRPNCDFYYFLEVETGINAELAKAGLRKRPLYVYLPPTYESNPRPLPVVYAIDGYNLFSNGKEGRFIDQFLDSQWNSGLIPEFILVAIPSMEVAFPGFEKKDILVKNFSALENETYFKFLLEMAVPVVRSRFRVSSNPKDSIIMGGHEGGLLAFLASLLHPDTFGQSVSLSPSFGYHDSNNLSIFDFLRKEKPTVKSNFYFDSSNLPGDNRHVVESMATHLSARKIPSTQYRYENVFLKQLRPKERLSNSDWQMRFGNALQFIFMP